MAWDVVPRGSPPVPPAPGALSRVPGAAGVQEVGGRLPRLGTATPCARVAWDTTGKSCYRKNVFCYLIQ